jgi:hypothetical protein
MSDARSRRPRSRHPRQWSSGRVVLATLAIGALVLSPVAQGAYAGELPAPPQSPAAEHPAQATTGSVPTYSQGLRSQKALIADVPDDSTASTPTPEQRLTRVDVARDLVKKTITAKATFAEAPTSDRDSAVYVFLGTWSGSSCTGRVVTAAAAASRSQFGALLGSDGTVDEEVDTTRSRSGKVLTIVTGPHDRIRTAKLDCAYALNLGAGDPAPRYTDFYAEDLENTFAPKLEVSTREPLQGNYKGKTTKVRIEVDNIGESDAKNVRIKASGTGLKISKPSRTIAKIEDGRSKFLTFNVTLTSKKQRTLTVTAVATGGKKVSTKVTIVEKPKPKKYKSLSGRYFWGYMPTTLSDYSGWETRAVWFLNAKWAYTDVPKNGKKPSCTKASSVCKRYAYNPKTGVAKIGSQKFKVTTEGFTYKARKKDSKKSNFEPITLAKKGSTFSTTLKRDDWSGYCMITCTATSERIRLYKSGKFVWQRSSVGNWSGIGSSWAIVPPDQRGTYKVISTGRIEFRYSDGTKKRYTFGVMKDIRGKTSTKEGIIVGGKNFY